MKPPSSTRPLSEAHFLVDVVQPRLQHGLGCLREVRALGERDLLRCLRRLGPNKWVDPAEVVANLLLCLLQMTLVHLQVEGVVLHKVAEDRRAVLLAHVPGLASKHRSSLKAIRSLADIIMLQAPGDANREKTTTLSGLAA